jgi:hypothetical protein
MRRARSIASALTDGKRRDALVEDAADGTHWLADRIRSSSPAEPLSAHSRCSPKKSALRPFCGPLPTSSHRELCPSLPRQSPDLKATLSWIDPFVRSPHSENRAFFASI